MSCIGGIIALNNLDIEEEKIKSMSVALELNAPDGVDFWVSRSAALAYAKLCVDDHVAAESQPYSPDGVLRIVADARIDDRKSLCRKLRVHGRAVSEEMPSSQLILHAYQVFGDEFLDHLIGDFAFAIWDARRGRLVCARDQMGARPLFYLKSSGRFVFSTNIQALLKSGEDFGGLRREAIADFLMFGNYLDAKFSIYKNIERLPAAHVLTLDQGGGLQLRRYWAPSYRERSPRYDSVYIEEFSEILNAAVSDRLPPKKVAIEMSGGMDSSSIAAISSENAKTTGLSIFSVTGVATPLLERDKEGYYARLVGEFLDIPIKYINIGNYKLLARYDAIARLIAEPLASADLAYGYDFYKIVIKEGARVLLNGFGADALFADRQNYYSEFLRNGRWIDFFYALAGHFRVTKTLRGLGLRSMLCKRPPPEFPFDFPAWIRADFVRELDLRERWHAGWTEYLVSEPGAQLSRPYWSRALEGEVFGLPIEVRFPFMDVRVVDFLMSLPNFLNRDKFVLRSVMRSRLPEQVRTRPKQGLAGDPVRARASTDWGCLTDVDVQSLVSGEFVDGKKYSQAFRSYMKGEGAHSTFSSYFMIQPMALHRWMCVWGYV